MVIWSTESPTEARNQRIQRTSGMEEGERGIECGKRFSGGGSVGEEEGLAR